MLSLICELLKIFQRNVLCIRKIFDHVFMQHQQNKTIIYIYQKFQHQKKIY